MSAESSASSSATPTSDQPAKALAGDAQSLVWLKNDAIYNPLRKEPRFIALMKKLNVSK